MLTYPVRTDRLSYADVARVFLKEECETTVLCLEAGGKTFRLQSFLHVNDERESRKQATAEGKRIADLLETRFVKA